MGMIASKSAFDVVTFQAQRKHIAEQHAAMAERAAGYIDQELARLYVRCGWTQERIAEVEGKTHQRISQLLLFGRFLSFATSGSKPQKPPKNLTERRFRSYFEQTDSKQKEQRRFARVIELIHEDLYVHEGPGPRSERKGLVTMLADGNWRTVAEMVEGSGFSEKDIKSFVGNAMQLGSHGLYAESRSYGSTKQYRLVKGGKKRINAEALRREAGPILDELEAEGKKNMARISPPTVVNLVHKLRQLIERMAR